jgi:hypothetical protein
MARSFRNSEITPGEVNEHSIATNPALTAAADLILRLTTSPHLVSLAASYGYIERETAATERLPTGTSDQVLNAKMLQESRQPATICLSLFLRQLTS